MKKFFFSFVAFALITSCVDDGISTSNNSIVPRSCVKDLSTQETIDIGEFHNEFLDILWGDLDEKDIDNSLAASIEDIMTEELTGAISAGKLDTIVTWIQTHGADGFEISGSGTWFADSATVKEYYQDILDAIDNSITFTGLSSALSTIKSNASSELTCMDLDFILSAAEVCENSAYYWMPTINGGLGNALLTGNGLQPRTTPWWKRAIIGDVEGLAGAFLTIGIGGMISAAVVPGTNVALAVTLGAAAAFGSAMGVAHGN